MFKYKIGDIVFAGNFYKVKIIKILIDTNEYCSYEVENLLNTKLLVGRNIDANLLEKSTELDPISQRKQKLEKLNEKL